MRTYSSHDQNWRVPFICAARNLFPFRYLAAHNIIWSPISSHGTPAPQPKFFAASTTLYNNYLSLLTPLTTIHFPHTSIIRGPSADFAQQNTIMSYKNRSNHVCQLKRVVDFIKDNTVHLVCIFYLSKKRSFHLIEKLKEKLDNATLEQIIDVIHVHGLLRAEEKYVLIRIFCQKYNLPEFTPCILVASAAANVGIDNHRVL